MAAWALLIVGWLLIWQGHPIVGVLCIALFALLQWGKYAAKGAQEPEEAAAWRKTDWRSQPIEMAHAGDGDRQIGGVGELGMGGPHFWTLLLRDGAIVHGACAAPQDVDGGKLRLIPTRSRQGEGLTVYEPAARMMYALPALADLEQEALAAGTGEALARLRARCRQANATPLHQVRGLWVPRWVEDPADRLEIALPSGRLLAAFSTLPLDLRHADDPAALLHAPPYALLLDNMPTDLLVRDLERVAESPAGDGFSVGGCQFHGEHIVDGLYHLHFAGEWFSMLSYAHKPVGGSGSDDTFFVERVEPQDGGVFVIEWDAYSVGSDGREPRVPAPPVLTIAVSWQEAPLQLRTANNRVTVRLPNATA
ncbi:hypothetical protein BHU62_03300 [Serratia marcescens]|uniref:Uncharacterized protein n=1 Tax=Serratia marcescens TaxID=615 RepID=A0A1Q4P537_SERMA|nr:hypothetical protein [Serratia marcescens]OKB68245.1 hypothetical protein BHU62_03300 [Serratia marcescens]